MREGSGRCGFGGHRQGLAGLEAMLRSLQLFLQAPQGVEPDGQGQGLRPGPPALPFPLWVTLSL